jgi:DNA-directed RNA polymerase subunit RPC12/RpoP
MALPILNTPTFEVELPLSKRVVKYRPFLVKEEKILLMALESQDQKQIMNAMRDIVSACTFDEVNARALPVSELEFLFLKLRAKSVGENANIGLKCSECSAQNDVDLNLEDIKLDLSNIPETKIMLSDTIGVIMKFPTSDDVLRNIDSKKSDVENTYAVIAACLDKIFDTENVYDVSTQSKKEVQDFIESLNKQQFEKIKDFFSSLPKLKHDLEYECMNCGHHNHVVLEGLESFFV